MSSDLNKMLLEIEDQTQRALELLGKHPEKLEEILRLVQKDMYFRGRVEVQNSLKQTLGL